MSPIVKVRVMGGVGDHDRSVVALSGASERQVGEFASVMEDEVGHELTILHVESPDGLGDIADAYYDVRPPIDDRMIRRFAAGCLRYLSNGHNTIDVIDNRETLPVRRFESAGPLVNFVR